MHRLTQVSTDIIHFLSKKLHYYKGDYDTFVNVRTELAKNQRRAYEASAAKKAHMQEFIDKFRSNAKRASLVQSRIKVTCGAGRGGSVRCRMRRHFSVSFQLRRMTEPCDTVSYSPAAQKGGLCLASFVAARTS